MTQEFGYVADPGGGNYFRASNFNGELLVMRKTGNDTTVTINGSPKPALPVQVAVLTGPEAGKVFPDDGTITQNGIMRQVKAADALGQVLLGRLHREGTGDQAPWKMLPPSEDDKALAGRWMAARRAGDEAGARAALGPQAPSTPVAGGVAQAPPF